MISTVDIDGDGSNDTFELQNLFDQLGFPISQAQIAGLINTVDIDSNGTLSYDEFITLLYLFNAPTKAESVDLSSYALFVSSQ